MKSDAPLDRLRMFSSMRSTLAECDDCAFTACERDIAAVERVLDAPEAKRTFPHLTTFSRFSLPARLPAPLLRRVEEATRLVWSSMGSGKSYLEEGLLTAIAFCAEASSLPFFRDAIAFTRPRDSLSTQRRRLAVAGIAFIAIERGSEEALATLESLLTHDDFRVRTWAASGLAESQPSEDERMSAKAAALLERVARTDRAFEPRFVARVGLLADGRDVPAEPPGGAYSFQASLGRASRTIELRSEQPLNALAWAIVSAFGWDHDHLYAFTMSAELKDDAFNLSYEFDPLSGADDDGGPLSAAIGALGLLVDHRFTLLYDFGDCNVFNVRVVDVKEKADARAKYPRVTAKVGAAPKQYG